MSGRCGNVSAWPRIGERRLIDWEEEADWLRRMWFVLT